MIISAMTILAQHQCLSLLIYFGLILSQIKVPWSQEKGAGDEGWAWTFFSEEVYPDT